MSRRRPLRWSLVLLAGLGPDLLRSAADAVGLERRAAERIRQEQAARGAAGLVAVPGSGFEWRRPTLQTELYQNPARPDCRVVALPGDDLDAGLALARALALVPVAGTGMGAVFTTRSCLTKEGKLK